MWFYFIVFLLVILFYLLVAPKHVKSTMNLFFLVFVVVGALFFAVAFLQQLLHVPLDFWLSVVMVVLGAWSIWDLHHMSRRPKKEKEEEISG